MSLEKTQINFCNNLFYILPFFFFSLFAFPPTPFRILMYVFLRIILNVQIPGYFILFHISVANIQDAGNYVLSFSFLTCHIKAIYWWEVELSAFRFRSFSQTIGKGALCQENRKEKWVKVKMGQGVCVCTHFVAIPLPMAAVFWHHFPSLLFVFFNLFLIIQGGREWCECIIVWKCSLRPRDFF